MDNETEKLIAKHMNLLKISRDEAIQLIEDDKRIDKGEKLFSLTPEQEKASKKARSAGRKPKTTVYKFAAFNRYITGFPYPAKKTVNNQPIHKMIKINPANS